jgi:hypothetical protein
MLRSGTIKYSDAKSVILQVGSRRRRCRFLILFCQFEFLSVRPHGLRPPAIQSLERRTKAPRDSAAV